MTADPKSRSLFPALEPPPGGAARLRASLRASPGASLRAERTLSSTRRGAMPGVLGPAAVAAIVLLAVIAWREERPIDPSADATGLLAMAEFDRLLGREPAPVALRVARGDEAFTLRQLQSDDPTIRLYQIDGAVFGSGTDDSP